MNVLVLVGSLRADSYNGLLAQAAIEALPEGVAASVFDGLYDLPHYNEDLEATAPESVHALRAAISDADALIVVTPEYNGAISSVLKNAIDWASRPRGAASIAGKPALVLAASQAPRNAIWARENAIRVLTVAGAAPLETSVGLADAYKHFADGALTDEATKAAISEGVRELLSAQLVDA